jgi:hypothetical protein
MRKIKSIFRYLSWILKGKPMIKYIGYNCGLCGVWVEEPFKIPDYKSSGRWADTWGVCRRCGGVYEIECGNLWHSY